MTLQGTFHVHPPHSASGLYGLMAVSQYKKAFISVFKISIVLNNPNSDHKCQPFSSENQGILLTVGLCTGQIQIAYFQHNDTE